MEHSLFFVLVSISMFEAGLSCDMSCLYSGGAINYTFFLIVSLCVIVFIFIFCAYLCFQGDESDGCVNRVSVIRTAASDLNEGTCDMIPAMLFD